MLLWGHCSHLTIETEIVLLTQASPVSEKEERMRGRDSVNIFV
jgi:hypothetical protein